MVRYNGTTLYCTLQYYIRVQWLSSFWENEDFLYIFKYFRNLRLRYNKKYFTDNRIVLDFQEVENVRSLKKNSMNPNQYINYSPYHSVSSSTNKQYFSNTSTVTLKIISYDMLDFWSLMVMVYYWTIQIYRIIIFKGILWINH